MDSRAGYTNEQIDRIVEELDKHHQLAKIEGRF